MGVMMSWEVMAFTGGGGSVVVVVVVTAVVVVEVESDLAGRVAVRMYASVDLVVLAERSSILISGGGSLSFLADLIRGLGLDLARDGTKSALLPLTSSTMLVEEGACMVVGATGTRVDEGRFGTEVVDFFDLLVTDPMSA